MASMMLLGASSAQAAFDAGCCYEPVCCEDQTGFYIGTFAGGNFITTCNHRNRSDIFRNRHNFSSGYVVDASIGYRWCNDLRFEFEYAYRNNKGRHRWRESRNEDTFCCSKRKNFVQNAYMFNAFYDLNLCNDWCLNLKPFVGVGIGYASGRNHHHRFDGERHRWNRDNGFAWQVIAGLAYPICDEIDLSLEYRFFKGRAERLYNNAVGVGLKYYF